MPVHGNTKTAIKCVFQTHLIYVLRDLNNNHDTVWNISAIHYFGMFYWLIVWREQYVNRSYGSYENVSHLVGWWLLLPGVLVNTIHGVTWGHASPEPSTRQGQFRSGYFQPKSNHGGTKWVRTLDTCCWRPSPGSYLIVWCWVLHEKVIKCEDQTFFAYQHFYKGDLTLKWFKNIHDLTRVIVGRWTDMYVVMSR